MSEKAGWQMNIFFTSDEHYGHENARTGWPRDCVDPTTGVTTRVPVSMPRPFSSLEEMKEVLIERNNAIVRKGDEVWHLGDMFWRTLSPVDAQEILIRLAGKHCYILGNHEELMQEHEPYRNVRKRFQEVSQRADLHLPTSLFRHSATDPVSKKSSQHIVLDHYAGRVWNGSHRGSWQLHGHSHGQLSDAGLLQMDVGVDCNGFAPVSLEQVRAFMNAKVTLP